MYVYWTKIVQEFYVCYKSVKHLPNLIAIERNPLAMQHWHLFQIEWIDLSCLKIEDSN